MDFYPRQIQGLARLRMIDVRNVFFFFLHRR